MTAKEATDLAFRELRGAENDLKLAKPEHQHAWRRHSIGQRLVCEKWEAVTMVMSPRTQHCFTVEPSALGKERAEKPWGWSLGRLECSGCLFDFGTRCGCVHVHAHNIHMEAGVSTEYHFLGAT